MLGVLVLWHRRESNLMLRFASCQVYGRYTFFSTMYSMFLIIYTLTLYPVSSDSHSASKVSVCRDPNGPIALYTRKSHSKPVKHISQCLSVDTLCNPSSASIP